MKDQLERIAFALQKALNMGVLNMLESKQIHSDLNEITKILSEIDGSRKAEKDLGDGLPRARDISE